MRSGSHPDVAAGERHSSGRWAGDEGFGDARSSPLSRGALGRQKGCPVVAPWVAASPQAWLLCSTSSQTCTCGVNPIISLRSDRFANHSHSPCQSTARLGDVAHTPRLLLLLHEDIVASCEHPALSGVCYVILKHFLSFSGNGTCAGTDTKQKSAATVEVFGSKQQMSRGWGRSLIWVLKGYFLPMSEAEGIFGAFCSSPLLPSPPAGFYFSPLLLTHLRL